MSWMQYDAMLKGWKTTTMEKNIHNNVKYVGTVSQIWSELLERFGKESYDRPYELKYKITAARLDVLSISTYFTNLRSLQDETSSVMPFPYCSCQNFPVTLEKVLMSSKKKNDCISSSLAQIPTSFLSKHKFQQPNPLQILELLITLYQKTTGKGRSQVTRELM